MNKVIETIKSHRSIRKFTKEHIPSTILQEIFDAARYASTSSFVQAYHIIRITDTTKRHAIYELSGEQPYINMAPEFLVFCADLHKLNHACELHGEKMDDGYMESMIVATVDASLVAQNLMLAAESFDLGGVYIGGLRNNIAKVSQLLNLPKHVYPLFGMCLGYPEQNPQTKPRMDISLILSENGYDAIDAEKLSQYDETVKNYYFERTHGKINHTWTEQMSEKMKNETRPFMLNYLQKQGFARK
ncbi:MULTISPECIES: oxygen-insensitive NADPH nitroreductase [unclassified Fusibacter]|uniref:oxygen-insensitive NADPH nitroreductase n=1 Tax=unclassified Fusibacter TaxID=2624464 RepID=UPI001013BBA8|nr:MULTISPECIES: oxygen-insensitive NADPH nitroreductase [unclassified Fusibacter]MCK8060838.1 oxygen-insensitive NADPH nitroreductase [Fusibacter sp. A2]NPE23134.1 oxygen-insensitive NADPH nitroreductase [Fusibacter sp. A1]RXV59806.1 oxygen-insensitive NADPH nitroreductase [Fusibacter sp. A1]